MKKSLVVAGLFIAVLSLTVFTAPASATLANLWNADPNISGHSYWSYTGNNVQVFLAPWGSSSWGFRGFTFKGGTYGTIGRVQFVQNNGIVYMYGYQGYTPPWSKWYGVVSMTQGHILNDDPAKEGWKKPTPLWTWIKDMQIELKYKEGTYGDNYNWCWNGGEARMYVNVWFEDRTNHYQLVLDLCLDEKIGWGGITGKAWFEYGANVGHYFTPAWSSSEKVPLGGGWYQVTLDLDAYLDIAMDYFYNWWLVLYDHENMWLYGAEFVLELFNAKREAWVDNYYLSYYP